MESSTLSLSHTRALSSLQMRMLVCMNGHVKRNPSTKEYTYDDTDVLLCSIGAPEACTTMSMLRAIVLPDDERANTYHLQYLMPPDENHLVRKLIKLWVKRRYRVQTVRSPRGRSIFATDWTPHPHPTGSIAPLLRDTGKPPPLTPH